MARNGPRKMHPVEREQAAITAFQMASMGHTRAEIAEVLNVSKQTVTALTHDAPEYLEITEEVKDRLRLQILTRLTDVQARCYKALDAKYSKAIGGMYPKKRGEIVIQPQSANFVPIMQTIMDADDRMVRLLGLDAPTEHNVNLNTVADWAKAYRDKVEERRAAMHAIEGGDANGSANGQANGKAS